ncbi:MAG: translation elongation factor Ts [Thermodesulfobacteriota bacterium]|nr:translation elongation factor Ts [Thermodesulfobacteriota bacterium]
MEISATMVKELRQKTGAPMMDCKKALAESGGDFEKAITYLRQKSLATVSKKAQRATTEGVVASYIHPGSKIGVLLELNCESDFVARNDEFQEFTKNMTMHIAALNPLYVTRENVPETVVEKERDIYRSQAQESGKPEKIWDKIVNGRLDKFFAEVCLLEQSYIKDDSQTVKEVLNELIGKLGENIAIRRFVRYQLGEELSH